MWAIFGVGIGAPRHVERADSFLRPKKSAFWTTSLAAASAAWVNFQLHRTIAYRKDLALVRGCGGCRRRSTPRLRVVGDARRLETRARRRSVPATAAATRISSTSSDSRLRHRARIADRVGAERSTRSIDGTRMERRPRRVRSAALHHLGGFADPRGSAPAVRHLEQAGRLEPRRCKGLGELATDRAAADHGESRGAPR